ncbi:MAG: PA2779 family protein [Pseudomonadota bacterium]
MKFRKSLALLLSTTLVWAGLTGVASAAVVSTTDAFQIDQTAERLVAVRAELARPEVQQAMVAMGVDPAEAQLRVAALSDAELAELQGQLGDLPAGGEILALLGAVFVVLLVLEFIGVINVFNKA